eukprot:CAMPEP_0172017014 /NCGR_PEP_ID=MMETSP1041-20130122/11335_1 /TAXON_ID=464988 /ORGANISM="Hemiselmis andersenii, Strain CCMP439" /LENGTH=30 /DNA_ID= /DNA_START= /DNA_END= /DNA_ORIENTATION=
MTFEVPACSALKFQTSTPPLPTMPVAAGAV